MNRSLLGISLLLAGALCSSHAMAWASANRFGGSTEHSYGSTEHTNRYGGSSEHAYGEGSEHTNAYGGSTAHAWGGGTEHTNTYGGTTYGAAGYGAAHTYRGGATAYRPPAYPAQPIYHPPVAVPAYAAGCYGCAAAAGAVVGVARECCGRYVLHQRQYLVQADVRRQRRLLPCGANSLRGRPIPLPGAGAMQQPES